MIRETNHPIPMNHASVPAPTPAPDVASPASAIRTLRASIDDVCRRIPPLWPLDRFVAVNPFVGMADRHFLEVASLLQRNAHADILLSGGDLLARLEGAGVTDAEVAAASAAAGGRLPAWARGSAAFADFGTLRQALAGDPGAGADPRTPTVADCVDAASGTAWSGFVVDEISKWCASYFDHGQSPWLMPGRGRRFFDAWKAVAVHDRNPECAGLRGFRALVAGIPEDPREAIVEMLSELGVDPGAADDLLHRELLSVAGWSGHVQARIREGGDVGSDGSLLVQLLAVRLAYDVALFRRFAHHPGFAQRWSAASKVPVAPASASPSMVARFIAQEILERHYQAGLLARLSGGSAAAAAGPGRPVLQAIFCIDVRSEPYRRCLEAQSDAIETIGFAGFFGMPIAYQFPGETGGEARCPVLLSPRYKVREVACRRVGIGSRVAETSREWRGRMRGVLDHFRTSAVSCFPYVETLGLGFAGALLRDSARQTASSGGGTADPASDGGPESAGGLAAGIPIADRIALGEGALRNMGLVSDFARVVLVCGHGSSTVNNPHAASLQCGACGGHSGDANARVAAEILNDAAVRAGLRERGIAIPDDTVFLAGLHDTTTDAIHVHGWGSLDAGRREEAARVAEWLAGATRKVRGQRTPDGMPPGSGHDAVLESVVSRRARDWAEVRPEWGLARNAAFVAAPRARTRNVDLGGRVFLNNYDAARDPDGSVLELILCAPVIVASWINLQYYASTVDNRAFGSGSKTLHNVVGRFGVWEGNGGDLRSGLPFQSLHDGTRWVHEPLRLSVMIEVPREAIARVLRSRPEIGDPVENGWIHLVAIEPGGHAAWRYAGKSSWDPMPWEPARRAA